MIRFITVVLLLNLYGYVTAQGRFESFSGSALPSNWNSSLGTVLALNKEHYKGGNQALKWSAKDEGHILVSGLNISESETGSSTSSSARFYVYSSGVSNDTLVFQFYDQTGLFLRREGRMLLNYKGWRDYHRSFRYDYNQGKELAGFSLGQVRIVYKAATQNGTNNIWFDEMTFVGDDQRRYPGPHMLLDTEHFFELPTQGGVDPNLNLLNLGREKDNPIIPGSAAELAGLQKLKTAYARVIPSVTSANLAAAKQYVTNSIISRNPDNTIKGRAITFLTVQDTLVAISKHVGSLARAAIRNNDIDAKNKLLLFTEYLLDQGLAEGNNIEITCNTYTNAQTFPIGFLEAMSLYPAAMREEVIKMLKWSIAFTQVYDPAYIERLNIDYIHVKSNFLFEVALLDPSANAAVRDLKCIKRFFELYTQPGDGGRDGIKPDGVGVHHYSHYMAYLYAYGTWIRLIHDLKGTPFKINKEAYENMKFAVKALFLETSKGTLYSNSESGRSPFPSSVPVSASDLRLLIEIGGDVLGESIDTELASFYNYMFQTSYYTAPKADLDGFYQFNYAQLGVLRKGNWIATLRGFTNKVFGTEIYPSENSYGRYQSYGTLEVLYDGSLTSTGYIKNGDGWDWNVMPGTTTVHLPFNKVRPISNGASKDEYQTSAFAGALAMGKEGVFGMDFIQNAGTRYATSNLKFRKSVFGFEDFLVCLGSGINTSNELGNVATNLFQGITTGTNPAIYINSTVPTSSTAYEKTFPLSSAGIWVVNGQTTGYYIPKGNSDLTIFRGSQTTPIETSFDGSITRTANVNKAWINHGTKPNNGSYHFVTVPAITATKMKEMSAKFEQQSIYQVLNHSNEFHAVRYIPKKLTSYVFFEGRNDVNVGYVKSISQNAIVGIREKGDSLIVSIANPDLNTVDVPGSFIRWKSTESIVDLTLKGTWRVAENTSNAGIENMNNALKVSFSLIHGFSATIKLVKDGAASMTPENEKLIVFPNPVTENARLFYNSLSDGVVHIKVMNIIGQVFLAKTVQVSEGDNNISLETASFKAGSYILKIKNGTKSESVKFIKQ